ncbi:MAG TPA: T9SS type A sorting domain-containing protein, partial [Flavobacterium sp.]|nr:T9SS type A sorting domain-containing protein [Flavobacterium sp.]
TFNAVPAATFAPGVLFAVRVAVMTTGTWSPFGDACEITSPGTAARFTSTVPTTESTAFKAAVYPNPFTSEFAIGVTTSSDENVQVKVYDMLGKLIESREVKVSELDAQKVGDRYPSGVYNVIVSQGDIVKTLRVIKR